MVKPWQISIKDSVISAAGACKLQCNELCNASFQVAAQCVFIQILHGYAHLQVVLYSINDIITLNVNAKSFGSHIIEISMDNSLIKLWFYVPLDTK